MKTPKPTERLKREKKKGRIKGIWVIPGILNKMAIKRAVRKLLAGPAKEIIAESFRGFLRLKGSIITGLPQPIWNINKARVPIGSRWARGLRVSRPSIRGVGSPSLSAARAWANS